MNLRNWGISLAAAGLSACAGKPLKIPCDAFAEKLVDLPQSAILQSIQADDAGPPLPPGDVTEQELVKSVQKLSLVDKSFQQWLSAMMLRAQKRVAGPAAANVAQANVVQSAADDGMPILLLSGGGQWGAFGAAFMDSAYRQNPQNLPPFGVVTGVSTGSMQSLFLGQGNDPDTRRVALAAMIKAYTIKDESEIVKRRSMFGVLTKGAMADLGPLYNRIMAELCPPVDGGKPSMKCPVAVGFTSNADRPTTLVGLVDAASGDFKYVSLNSLASSQLEKRLDNGKPDPGAERMAANCVAAAVLASSAMPLYYQQVMVGDDSHGYRTYIDGGARNSVFLAQTAKMFSPGVLRAAFFTSNLNAKEKADAKTAADMGAALPQNDPIIYVVRNGPTVAAPAADTDKPWNALDAAQRAYALLVNQSEVNAIAGVRLLEAKAPLNAITADGFDNQDWLDEAQTVAGSNFGKLCVKSDASAMFDPRFMECLRQFGELKGLLRRNQQRSPWIEIAAQNVK